MSEQAYVNNLKNLANSVNYYYSITIVPVGMVLNLLTIFVYSTGKLRKLTNNLSVFYIILGVYDILALSNSILFIQLLPTINIKLFNYSDELCKFISLWRRTVIQSPSWIQIIITLDRFRSVVCPSRFGFMKNRLVLILMLASVFFVLMLVNLGHLWFYTVPVKTTVAEFNQTLNKTINKTTTSLLCTSSAHLATATDVMNVLLRSYIPFVIMFTLNIMLTRKFLQSKKNLNTKSSMKKEYNFTMTVIGMNLTFFTLYTPWSVWYIINQIVINTPGLQSNVLSANLNLFQSFAFSIAYLNNSFSFILNLVFNSLFRGQIFNLVTNQNQVSTTLFQSTNVKSNKTALMNTINSTFNEQL